METMATECDEQSKCITRNDFVIIVEEGTYTGIYDQMKKFLHNKIPDIFGFD